MINPIVETTGHWYELLVLRGIRVTEGYMALYSANHPGTERDYLRCDYLDTYIFEESKDEDPITDAYLFELYELE